MIRPLCLLALAASLQAQTMDCLGCVRHQSLRDYIATETFTAEDGSVYTATVSYLGGHEHRAILSCTGKCKREQIPVGDYGEAMESILKAHPNGGFVSGAEKLWRECYGTAHCDYPDFTVELKTITVDDESGTVLTLSSLGKRNKAIWAISECDTHLSGQAQRLPFMSLHSVKVNGKTTNFETHYDDYRRFSVSSALVQPKQSATNGGIE